MPIQNFSQHPMCNTQANACCVGYSESKNTTLKSAYLIIDESLANYKSRFFYLEDELEKNLLDLIKQFKTLTSVEDIMVAIRGEISLLNKKLVINQTNLQQCIEKLNRAINYQQQVGELSPIFKGTIIGFMMWLSLLIILKEYFLKDRISPFELGKMGVVIMAMNIYLAFYEVVNLRVNNAECKKSTLERNERQLTQQSQFLIDLEAKLDAPIKINQIDDDIDKVNAFARPTSISEYLLKQKEDKQVVSDQVGNEHNDELHFRAGAYKTSYRMCF